MADYHSTPWDAYTTALGGYIGFNYAEGTSQRGSPFWRAFREVCEVVGVSAPRGTAWSNVVKVKKVTEGDTSFLKLSAKHRVNVLDWQYSLFKAEMAMFKPKRVLHRAILRMGLEENAARHKLSTSQRRSWKRYPSGGIGTARMQIRANLPSRCTLAANGTI
jgi:hypothetical protein